MSEFLHTVWGGVFPFFLFFALIGIVGRIRRRQWTGFDSLLILVFLVFELLAAFQVRMFYGLLTTSRRYLFIGIPLYLPFTALGFLDLWRVVGDLRFGKSVAAVVLVSLCAVFFYTLYCPIFIELSDKSEKGMERDLQIAAAEWIRADWDKLPASKEGPLRAMKCDQYQPGKRPLVDTNCEWPRLGFMSDGQNYPEFLRGSEIRPDYIVLPADPVCDDADPDADAGLEAEGRVPAAPEGFLSVHTETVDGITFFIFRNAAL